MYRTGMKEVLNMTREGKSRPTSAMYFFLPSEKRQTEVYNNNYTMTEKPPLRDFQEAAQLHGDTVQESTWMELYDCTTLVNAKTNL